MTHIFNTKKTEEFFDRRVNCFSNTSSPRDNIFLDIILPLCKKGNKDLKVIDFGCGAGGLILKLHKKGIKSYGIEKHNKLYNITKEKIEKEGFNKDLIIQGGIESLNNFEEESVDIIILMGVMQYLSLEDYNKIFRIIHKILKRNGSLVCSFQNALFDMFTFNKYTLDFYKEKFIKPLNIKNPQSETEGMVRL